MKRSLLLGICLGSVSVWGAEFVNLTFDNPDLSRLRNDPLNGTVGPVRDLLRGWEVSLRPLGADWQPFQDEIQIAITANGQTPVSLSTGFHFDPADYGVWFSSPAAPIGGPGQGIPGPDIRLSTTGTVPAGALTFDWLLFPGSVSIDDGQTFKMGAGSSLDVSLFAGKDVTLSFFVNSGGAAPLDVVGFSVVPEPQTWALLGVGLGVLWLSRRK